MAETTGRLRHPLAGQVFNLRHRLAALIWLLALPAALAAPPLHTERLWLFGREYYRLDEWARVNGLQLKWLGGKEVQAASGSTRIVFTGDSRRMTFNGVAVSLSHDIAIKNGTAYLTPLDANTTLSPLLRPPRLGNKRTVKHICLDAGHGGKDVGEHTGREQEKKYTLLLATELGEELRKAGYTVSFTRASDVDVDLGARPDIARRRGADLFVSIHFNSDGRGSSEVRGVETYCLTPASANSTNDRSERGNTGAVSANRHDANNLLLAYEVQKAMVRGPGTEDRGVKRARYKVLRLAEMPAILVESGFLSNPAEARKITSSAWRRQVAQAIVAGIRNYRALVEK